MERHSSVIYVAAGCGLRSAEITGLEIDAIHSTSSEIDVTRQLVCVTGQEPCLGPLKTKTSAHTAEMPAVTLARHIKAIPAHRVEIWNHTNPAGASITAALPG